jgi:hypothetical protein
MPYYYFHFLDLETANLIRDSAGISLRNRNEAQREATSLARDILRHPIQALNWQVVVTDATANVVLRVPLSKVRARKFESAFNLIRRIAFYEPRVSPHVFTWLVTGAVFAIVIESLLFGGVWRRAGDGGGNAGEYRLAGETTRLSGPSEQACGQPDE